MGRTGLKVLLVDDEPVVHRTVGEHLRCLGHEVSEATNSSEALGLLEKGPFDVLLLDHLMPGMTGSALLEHIRSSRPGLPVVMMTAHGDVDLVVNAFRHGAADFLCKPVKLLELEAVLEKFEKTPEGADGKDGTPRDSARSRKLGGTDKTILGDSPSSQRVRETIRLAAEARCDTLLLVGETGTGKEVAARQFHRLACGVSRPFVAVNCPSLPATLVESELFGHCKGAFTGAVADRAGFFEMANGGTIFLDEVADLSAAAQANLLRVLETRMIRRIGAARETLVDVRILAASNTRLEELAEQGLFRKDLYYRLSAFVLELDPLRKRREDIGPLARHFLDEYSVRRGVRPYGFTQDAEAFLTAQDWPGNTRQLRHVVERAAILRNDGPLRSEDLEASVAPLPKPTPGEQTHVSETGRDCEAARIRGALEACRWNRKAAAKLLEMPYSTLRYKMTRFRID